MIIVRLFATHAQNVGISLIDELLAIGAEIEENECSPTTTSFSMNVTDIMDDLFKLRSLKYADEVYLKMYHNKMYPSKNHPSCPVELRVYLSLLFYSINYVPEISRCIEIMRKLNNRLPPAEKHVVVHLVILTSERSSEWTNGLQIVRKELHKHVEYAMKMEGHSWTIRCHDTMFKSDTEITAVVFVNRHNIYAGVLLYDEEFFRPYLTFWQLNGTIAATAIEMVGVHDGKVIQHVFEGDIVLDMACDSGELTLEVLRNYDCFCIAMSPLIDQLAMAEVNWVGLQNYLKKEAGNRARHLQFIAVEFNKDFFNFNVVNKILCSLPLRWWNTDEKTLDIYYDKLFTIISKCRQETYSVLLIPLMKNHKRRINEGSISNKYNFQVLNMRRLMTRTTQMYVCLLETKLPRLAFSERDRTVDLLVPQDLPRTFDFSVSQASLLGGSRAMNLPHIHEHFIHNPLCIPMLHPTTSLDLPIQHTTTSIELPIPCSTINLPSLSNEQLLTSNVFNFLLDDQEK
ncbi:hypothetical protein DICVIV_10922 [Dictyocaulus viviparus]|uniref:Uncharacterized protein n=1 Tax=Dictyocaulus viviparus TaxID=29172 RepID=A0A0D8XH52_DICVI|nr:hypothetical protein DICVIV_10922 [Dictyocaulus viviparus]